MRVTVFGAGAIGGLLGASFARSGQAVSLIARGAHLAAIRANGLRLVRGGESGSQAVPASDDPRDFGVQDVVVLAVKAPALRSAIEALPPLLGPATVVVPALNGIPWWYGASEPLQSVDPGGALLRALDVERIVGCVVHAAASVPEPGTVVHTSGDLFYLGEPDGSHSSRLEQIVALFNDAGLRGTATADIRREIWVKAWGNAAFNPLSVVAEATIEELCTEPHLAAGLRAIMAEVRDVAAAQGVAMPMSIEERVDVARRLGAFKSSMLQDYEARRPLELDAILGAVIELGHRSRVAVPALETLYGLAFARAKRAGCISTCIGPAASTTCVAASVSRSS
jgi:2-dehydropantoate 2-reductase